MLFAMVAAFAPFRNLVLSPMQRQMTPMIVSTNTLPAAPRWFVCGAWLALAGMCLWSVAVLLLCLFGLRERALRVCLLMAAVTTAASCITNLPHAGLLITLLLVVVVGGLTTLQTTRRALGVVLAAAVALAVGLAGLVFFIATLSTRLETAERVNDWAAMGGLFAAFLLATWVMARARKWARITA